LRRAVHVAGGQAAPSVRPAGPNGRMGIFNSQTTGGSAPGLLAYPG